MVMSLWTAIHPALPRVPDAKPIADATVDVVLEDEAAGKPPILSSYNEDIATQAYWAQRESDLRHGAVGDGGRSFGTWQMRAPGCGKGATIRKQARCWREMLRDGAKQCPASPTAIFWGGCAIDLTPYGFKGWTSARAGLARVDKARKLWRAAYAENFQNPAQDPQVALVPEVLPGAQDGVEDGVGRNGEVLDSLQRE
jgi:hypothetical protein